MRRIYWFIRLALKDYWVKRDMLIEYCQRCGIRQPVVWWCESNALWEEVTGIPPVSEKESGGGIYCPRCFDEVAMSKGILIQFRATICK